MRHARSPHRSAGFSLVELMVGLLIGMIAIIVMMQVFSLSEGYKRTTTGGDDAQNNGAIALYGLQRDLQQSGLGAGAFQVIGCNVLLRAGVTLNAMSPVTINHASIPASASDAGTDTLLVVYGNGNGEAEGEKVQAQPIQSTYTVAAAAASASAPGAFAVGDRVIAEVQPRPSPCNLTMEAVTGVAATNVTVVTGVAGMSGGILYNLGQAPRVLVYAVKGGNLTVCDYIANDCGATGNVGNAAIWTPIASNIVSLRAEYGRDTTAPMDGTVDAFDQSAPTTACLWARVSAVRLVLVARSAQYDKAVVTTSAPVWASTSAAIDLSGNANWQQYRYKLFQTVVPLRNMAWQGAQAGC
jgi:type IV pilus assembly protein PilW